MRTLHSYDKSMAVIITFLLALMMLMPPNMAYAASTYTATGTESGADIAAIIAGTKPDASGNPYDSVEFPAGNYKYDLPDPVIISRPVKVKADTGAKVEFKGGSFRAHNNSADITFTGAGSFEMNNLNSYGFFSSNVNAKFNFDHTNFTIDGAKNFGIYAFGGCTMNIKGGSFTVKNCSNTGNEGGIEFDKGKLNVSDGAQLIAENNGNGTFGDIYMNGAMEVTGAKTKVIINESKAGYSGYGMVLAGGGTLKVDAGSVDINTSAAGRGINAGSNATNTIDLVNGAKLNVTAKGGIATSGIRRAKVSVKGGSVLDVKGYSYAFDGSLLEASDRALVTLNGKVMDNASLKVLTGGTNGSTIMGGSVLENYKTSVVNGVVTENPAGNHLDNQPVNTAGEKLMRFDLKNFEISNIDIAADPGNAAHPAYTYRVGKNHGGTAYVWAPAVEVRFWQSKEALDKDEADKMIVSLSTIRGNKLGFVGAKVPEAPKAPAGKVFSHWVNANTGRAFDSNAAFSEQRTNVYPVYKDAPAGGNNSTKKVVKVHKVSPRTGDASMIFLYGGLVVGAVVVLMVLIKIRRRA